MMMTKMAPFLIWVIIALFYLPSTQQLQSSQSQTLLRIKGLLGLPQALQPWNISTDFCSIEPSQTLTIVCYEDSITQLHITGNRDPPPPALKSNSTNFTASDFKLLRSFSAPSFFTTLARLPNLKVLTLTSLGLWGPLPAQVAHLSSLEILNISSNFFYGRIPEEISLLKNLQTVILDSNMFSGAVPESLTMLPVLAVLSLRNNFLNGSLPSSLSSLENVRILDLSSNFLYGKVPDLSSLTNLQVLNLADNYFGPQFPEIGNELVVLVLRNNKFASGIPSSISSCYQLQTLDISSNRFGGPFLPDLLSLPAMRHLNISGNRLTGILAENMSCNSRLENVDLSSNLLTGSLPSCLVSNLQNGVFFYGRNCLSSESQNQHPYAFCRTEALAVGLSLANKKKEAPRKMEIALGILGGLLLAIALSTVLLCVLLRRSRTRSAVMKPPRRLVAETVTADLSSKLLTNARYITQTMKLGALALPPYRTFALEELEEATNNFEPSCLMGEGALGPIYRGRLRNGSMVAIRCVKVKKKQNAHNFTNLVELVSKLRHHHLVSALGHCFEYYLDDSSISRLFLVFEYVSNGTLRENISAGGNLNWTQRISTAVSIMKGLQFLHNGVVPGILGNELKATNILLDQNLVAKISSYNLPVLVENTRKEVATGFLSHGSKEANAVRNKQKDKIDIYDFGVILLEIVTGRAISSPVELKVAKDQVLTSVTGDQAGLRSTVDPPIRDACSEQSLRTVMEIGVRCLSEEPTERPSVEDVLWNLQFAAQIQEASRSDGSPVSLQ
ncbi:probable inactive leucine-rich repeat receptor-like protein kinase At3g03770 isoform X1 [Nymphaea colorata]|nr:probable inactive leucine-rich repeat receptor-like protein kinase At3g03770 isoform X1 [Nymphaea colorata]XP_031495197.1 probable inactive leucine-rich repeat receptor-like protein kinase At3g03770 isoform X1 [Nymphaea colorata]XP_031495211.1 probable inactive leucine-rich repeat receptor-like protein kinase At3g03770 isoform X1 [Nymphaea colorata]